MSTVIFNRSIESSSSLSSEPLERSLVGLLYMALSLTPLPFHTVLILVSRPVDCVTQIVEMMVAALASEINKNTVATQQDASMSNIQVSVDSQLIQILEATSVHRARRPVNLGIWRASYSCDHWHQHNRQSAVLRER